VTIETEEVVCLITNSIVNERHVTQVSGAGEDEVKCKHLTSVDVTLLRILPLVVSL